MKISYFDQQEYNTDTATLIYDEGENRTETTIYDEHTCVVEFVLYRTPEGNFFFLKRVFGYMMTCKTMLPVTYEQAAIWMYHHGYIMDTYGNFIDIFDYSASHDLFGSEDIEDVDDLMSFEDLAFPKDIVDSNAPEDTENSGNSEAIANSDDIVNSDIYAKESSDKE